MNRDLHDNILKINNCEYFIRVIKMDEETQVTLLCVGLVIIGLFCIIVECLHEQEERRRNNNNNSA